MEGGGIGGVKVCKCKNGKRKKKKERKKEKNLTRICNLHQCGLGTNPSTAKFRVAFGRESTMPSSSFAAMTWHPSLDVSVRPNARSSMSFSSSSGSGKES